jgi:hypothetical protein
VYIQPHVCRDLPPNDRHQITIGRKMAVSDKRKEDQKKASQVGRDRKKSESGEILAMVKEIMKLLKDKL